jgi:splicing factor 3A subunit 1
LPATALLLKVGFIDLFPCVPLLITFLLDRIRDKEKHNSKFSFLSPNDAYNAFYVWRKSEIQSGRGTAVSAGRAGESASAPEAEAPKGPEQPPEFTFSARMPNLNALDLDVVRLTALFVAKNGRQFMTTLSQKEARNFQFDFLRPNHSLYQFFTRLVDQYTELLRATGTDGGGKVEQERMRQLQHNVTDRFHVLGLAKRRADWAKFQELQKQEKESAEEQEKLAYAQIDWHDFVVVETVLFTDADEQADLPPPTSLNDLQSASLEQKAMMSLNPNMRIEEAMPTSEDWDQSSYPAAQQTYGTDIPYRQQQETPDVTMHAPEQDDEEEAYIRERTEARAKAQQAQAEARGGAGPMKIRSDYVPRAAAQAASRRGIQTALCPNCGQQIPLNELDQHMRSKS